jgi:3-isopropylmalate/(R)-2-methylmalate dehydratase small subunit
VSLNPLQGRVAWIFDEDNYDIDLIIGIKNIKLSDLEELAAVTMSAYEPNFRQAVKPGDLLVAGHNFGYGHPHYPAMKAMRYLGISVVIAESFSPGFFRGEISMGFPLVTCPGIRAAVSRWDTLRVDWQAQTVSHLSRSGPALAIEPLASADRGMLESGGLVPYLQARLAAESAARSATPAST